ncbi:hypothetical protein BC830DRAFT_1147274 [Chytriomyces sp. MP71]|nr:hypothetical protein BC830DRAFT_1147274 [Chytriomyces sp. MP71]
MSNIPEFLDMLGPMPLGPDRRPVASIDEVLKSTPLFMQSLGDAEPDNDTLNALQSLLYDGTPEETALNFKEQGNEAFQNGKKGYKTAVEYYSKGIAAKCDDAELNSVLYSNRAAVNLELGNFRRVLNDCSEAIKLNPKNVKAFYRSTKALLSLDRIIEARDSCKMGLELDPKNTTLLDIQTKIESRHQVLEKSRLAVLERERAKREEEQALQTALHARGVVNLSTLKKLDQTDYEDTKQLTHKGFIATHTPILDASTLTVSYPVLFLYPEHTLSDLISAFHEQDAFADHLAEMFGAGNRPAWDTVGNYTPEALEVYFETRPDLEAVARGVEYRESRDGKRKLMRVDPQSSLAEVIASGVFKLVDGVASFFVLSSKSAVYAKKFRKTYR